VPVASDRMVNRGVWRSLPDRHGRRPGIGQAARATGTTFQAGDLAARQVSILPNSVLPSTDSTGVG
jgi:hypothetical protein